MLAAPAANNDVPYISSLVKNSVSEKLSSGCSAEEQPPPPVFHVFPSPREKLLLWKKNFGVKFMVGLHVATINATHVLEAYTFSYSTLGPVSA